MNKICIDDVSVSCDWLGGNTVRYIISAPRMVNVEVSKKTLFDLKIALEIFFKNSQ